MMPAVFILSVASPHLGVIPSGAAFQAKGGISPATALGGTQLAKGRQHPIRIPKMLRY